jgi:hypothetical protein
MEEGWIGVRWAQVNKKTEDHYYIKKLNLMSQGQEYYGFAINMLKIL